VSTAVTVTDEHLQRAWRRLRKPHWPVTLAEVLDHPMWGRCVRGMALALARVENRAMAPTAPRIQQPGAQTSVPHPTPAHTPRPPAFDHKRAAAGDRDDLDA
jgi:hypothetical protein